MQDYRKLDVWTKSHELAVDVHRLPAEPAGSIAGAELRSAVRRPAVRVPVLIVRGCEGETAAEFFNIKLRQTPPMYGVMRVGRSMPVNAEVRALADRAQTGGLSRFC